MSAIMAAVLSACGGGGSGSADSGTAPIATDANGVAAVGAPIVGGDVALKCASGATAETTTAADGTWKASLKSSDYPCVVRVTNGQADGQALPTPLYSVLVSAGIANITPLTDLMVGIMSQNKSKEWFETANPADLNSVISAVTLDNAQEKLKETLASLPGKPQLPANFNPITSGFSAQKGDAGDDLLESYGIALDSAGLSHADALGNASAGKPLTEEAFAGSAFTFPHMTTFRAGAAKLLNGDYVLSIPDPVREPITAKATLDAQGNVVTVGQPLSHVTSLLGNRIAQYCKGEKGTMNHQQRGFYAYISEDWTPVTDSKELHGKIFDDYEDCTLNGTIEFLPNDSVVFTDLHGNADEPDTELSKAFTTEGMTDSNENALVHAKAYKITLEGKTTYAVIAVATSKSEDKQSVWGNYMTLSVSK